MYDFLARGLYVSIRLLGFIWVVGLNAQIPLPHTRVFHDIQQRPLEAELLKVEGDRVYLRRLADSVRFWVDRSTLSEADQVWLSENFAENAASGSQQFEPLDWPARAEPSEDLEIRVVEESYKDGSFIYASNHFQYVSPGRLTRTLVRDFAEVFEATYAAVTQMPLPWHELPPDEPMLVLLFDNEEAYYAAGGIPNSGGTYSYDLHRCLVPVSSLGLEPTSTGYRKAGNTNYRILLHEVTHQVTHQWRVPVWLREGIAEYVERMPYDDGVVHFRRYDVKKVVRDAKQYIEGWKLVHPDTLLRMSSYEWNSSFTEDDPYILSRQYLSAFVLTAFYLDLSDDESARNLENYLKATLSRDERDPYLTEHSSQLDLETRLYRALRSLGISAEFY